MSDLFDEASLLARAAGEIAQQHILIDTIRMSDLRDVPEAYDSWVGRCVCGFRTLGRDTPELAGLALEPHIQKAAR